MVRLIQCNRGRRYDPRGRRSNRTVASPVSSKCASAFHTTAMMNVTRRAESVESRGTPTTELSTFGRIIPRTLATMIRDSGDRDFKRLDVILGTLATKLIGETNTSQIASVGRVPVAFQTEIRE